MRKLTNCSSTEAVAGASDGTAPPWTLWAVVVKERLEFDRAPAPTLGQAVATRTPTSPLLTRRRAALPRRGQAHGRAGDLSAEECQRQAFQWLIGSRNLAGWCAVRPK